MRAGISLNIIIAHDARMWENAMCLLVQGCKAQIKTRDETCETALS